MEQQPKIPQGLPIEQVMKFHYGTDFAANGGTPAKWNWKILLHTCKILQYVVK